mgnify:CR=1 FL=1
MHILGVCQDIDLITFGNHMHNMPIYDYNILTGMGRWYETFMISDKCQQMYQLHKVYTNDLM